MPTQLALVEPGEVMVQELSPGDGRQQFSYCAFFKKGQTVASMVTGTVSAITLIALSPTVQVDLLKKSEAIIALKNPGIITIALSFAVGIVASLVKPEPEAAEKFTEVSRRMHLGPTGDKI